MMRLKDFVQQPCSNVGHVHHKKDQGGDSRTAEMYPGELATYTPAWAMSESQLLGDVVGLQG
jgi:hypothetical protein